MTSKEIRINHVEAVENYLERNVGVSRGVSRLISNLPKSFEPKDIKKFYKKTGLKVQTQVMKDCCGWNTYTGRKDYLA